MALKRSICSGVVAESFPAHIAISREFLMRAHPDLVTLTFRTARLNILNGSATYRLVRRDKLSNTFIARRLEP